MLGLRLQRAVARTMSTTTVRTPAEGFVEFVNAAVSPYHAAAESARRLRVAGFTEVHERDV